MTLLNAEMDLTANYFAHRAQVWQHAIQALTPVDREAKRGHVAYARGQQAMWLQLKRDMDEAAATARKKHGHPVDVFSIQIQVEPLTQEQLDEDARNDVLL